MSWFVDFMKAMLAPKNPPGVIVNAMPPDDPPIPMKLPGVMLILPGIAGSGSMYDPNGLLDRKSASKYSKLRGYSPFVLDVSGETGSESRQVAAALKFIKNSPTPVRAIYGFSGGGYNVRHVIDKMTVAERAALELVVVLGAPGNSPSLYKQGNWELVYRLDPPEGHMAGPRILLADAIAQLGTGVT